MRTFVGALSGVNRKRHRLAVEADRNMNSFTFKEDANMKTSILVAAMVACTLSASVVSAQEKTAPAKPTMNMGMSMDKQMPQMQENMKQMQQQMEKIRATTEPKERQKLMQAHMQAMQENMKAMRGMGGPMMMAGGEHGGMMKHDMKGAMKDGMKDGAKDGMKGGMKDGMKDGDMMKHRDMMEKRMDMMQMMMEQMMQRDQMMQPMPAK